MQIRLVGPICCGNTGSSSHMFSWRNKKNNIWIPPLIWSYVVTNVVLLLLTTYFVMMKNSQQQNLNFFFLQILLDFCLSLVDDIV